MNHHISHQYDGLLFIFIEEGGKKTSEKIALGVSELSLNEKKASNLENSTY